MKCWTPELRSWLDAASREAGFVVAGIASVHDPGDPAAAQRFSDWVDCGRAGEMEYLKRRDESGTLVRGSVSTAFPWARSVIVCAIDYRSNSARSIDSAPSTAGWIARYAWSGYATGNGETGPADYHEDMISRLRRIESGLLGQAACETRCYVDTGPLVERAVASDAGIGWIGKNTCLINQRLGSWLLLGVILTSLPVQAESMNAEGAASLFAVPAADRCGSCTRCIDACPTGALLGSHSAKAAREMDASRCIAYLTIEKKGEIAEELRAPIGRNIFGCDICQEVCPWNAKAAARPAVNAIAQSSRSEMMKLPAMRPRDELVNPELEWLAGMDSREFRRWFRGSPLERTGRKRLLRNIAIAMGNSGEARFLPILDKLTEEHRAAHPNDLAIRNAVLWAREQILAGEDVRGRQPAQESGPNCGSGGPESVC